MTSGSRQRKRVTVAILLLSAAAWVVLLVDTGSTTLAHCPVTESGPSADSFWMFLEMNPTSSLAIGWAVMLVAMMAPTLIAPIIHVLERSFTDRRGRAVVLFVLGYGAVWMFAGLFLIAAMIALTLLAPQSLFPALGIGIVAVIWQCSPLKQLCLNRSHNHRELAAFGITADLDSFRFGMTHGGWCVGSCWALMLLPMLISSGHFVAMALVTFVMVSERLEEARPLTWNIRFPGKLLRIVVAQCSIRLRRRSFDPFGTFRNF